MIVEESFSLETDERDFVGIRHVQVWDTGVNMGGLLWFERRNLGWVVATLKASLRIYAFPVAELARGDDHLSIREAGHEHSPYTHLLNRRRNAPVHRGVFAQAFSRPVAEQLVVALDALRER